MLKQRVPRWLTAELTYRCPLSCFYCSNPVQMTTKNELSTDEWLQTFRQARDLGCIQLGLTGGEPLMRPDLHTLVKEARSMGFYSNLITSAVGLTRKKLEGLRDAGLDSVQISFQAEQKELNAFIGGKDSYDKKLEMMQAVKDLDMPLTLNVVIHRLNIDRMRDICEFCDSFQPDHVEIASTQYHGWAHKNRKHLLPTPEQVARAQLAIEEYQRTSSGSIYYVLPDLIEKRAKPCQQGWGMTYMCVNPQGDVTPCLSAHTLPSLRDIIPNVRKQSLQSIWEGPVFQQYQGVEWMNEDAKYSERRREDMGGCRCQAYLLTGDECAMDPADESARHHPTFLKQLEEDYSFQSNPASIEARKIRETR